MSSITDRVSAVSSGSRGCSRSIDSGLGRRAWNHPADATDIANDVLVELPPHVVDEDVQCIAFHLVAPVVQAILELAAR